MAAQINFRNVVQAALYKCEITGQISDGMWENTRPYDHWKIWCNANVNVNPKQVGRNFYTVKDNYNLSSNQLLGVIGTRMLNIANMAENGLPLEVIDSFNDYNPNNRYQDHGNSTFWADKRKEFQEYFGDTEGYKKAITGSYDLKKLKTELNDMKQIFKTKI